MFQERGVELGTIISAAMQTKRDLPAIEEMLSFLCQSFDSIAGKSFYIDCFTEVYFTKCESKNAACCL